MQVAFLCFRIIFLDLTKLTLAQKREDKTMHYRQAITKLAIAKTLASKLKETNQKLPITAEEGCILLDVQEVLEATSPTVFRALYLTAGLTDEDWSYIEARLHYHYERGTDVVEQSIIFPVVVELKTYKRI